MNEQQTDGPLTGAPVRRLEDEALVTGRAAFVADIDLERHLGSPGDAAHVAFVRSPYAAATIIGIDVSEAGNAPGVLAVVTGADIAHLTVGAFSYSADPDHHQPILSSGAVRFAGEPVAAVVASTAAQAADAVELVAVEFDPGDAVVTIDDALARGHVLDYADLPADHDADCFGACDVIVTRTSINPRQSPAPIEPRAMACLWTEQGRLLVWAATQRPHGFKDQLARTYGLAPERIRVVAPAVGGGFGGKVSRSPEEHLLPELARLVDRPVRWNETRSEYFLTSTQGRGERVEVTLAGTEDGRFEAIRVDLAKDGGAYAGVGALLAETYGRATGTGVYDIAHAEFASTAVLTNLPPVSAFRGAGRAPIIAAIERAVDDYAARAGIDPAELRRRNLVQPGDMPYTTATGAVLDEADYPATLEQALAGADYDRVRSEQAARRQAADPVELGIGIGCYHHMTVGVGGEEAVVTVEPDGGVTVVTGSTSQGHGHATTWAQLASDILAIPIERVTVVEGDTDRVATGQGAIGSRSAQTAGVAVSRLSNELVERARALAADRLEAAVGDVVLARPGAGGSGEPGFHVVGTPAARVGWAELAADVAGGRDELSCGEYYDAEGRVSFPSGCHVAVVEVDTETGRVAVVRLVAADDAGPRLNPMVVEGQLHGGIASGIAQALGEVMHYDERGTPLTANFADYAIGTIDWFPSFELVADPATVRSSFNELGVKGVGESGTIGATAAVQNAIVDALRPRGVDHVDLPCTPERVWAALMNVGKDLG